MTPPPIFAALALVTGTALGSFVTTAALRQSRSEQAVFGRSRCDHCRVTLGFSKTLPIVSYVVARGVCSSCGGRIERAHFVGEVAGAGVGISAFINAPDERGALVAGLGFILLGAAVYDGQTRKLPDLLTAAAAVLSGTLAAHAGTLASGAASALVAFVLLECVRRGFTCLRRAPGLGFGDVKLIAALALWLGALTSWAVVLASVLGLAAVRVGRPADGRIAFGPMIALSAFALGLAKEGGWWPA